MNYTIEIKKSAAKSLKKIPRLEQQRIVKKIDDIAEDLPNQEMTKMKGDNPFHKIRVGNYRIIYEIQEEILIILIVKIGHRKDVYRNIS